MRRLAVLGFPVSHSLSPAIHNAAFQALGLGDEWTYDAIGVEPADFEPRVRAMPAAGYVGANVTVPHKLAALALADTSSSTASEIGAANTLSFRDGSIRADNTDASGFLSSLPRSPAGLPALVLGAGGAARAVVWALLSEGAEVAIWNRTPARARQLASGLGAAVLEPDAETGLLSTADHDLIVNSTSVGLAPSTEPGADLKALCLDADSFAERQTVVDLVYGPEETEFLRSARERGSVAIDGREVLIHQGAASFRIWTGLEPPMDAMREAARPTDDV